LEQCRVVYLFRNNVWQNHKKYEVSVFHRAVIEKLSFEDEIIRTKLMGQMLYNSIKDWPLKYRVIYFNIYGIDLPPQIIQLKKFLANKRKSYTQIDYNSKRITQDEVNTSIENQKLTALLERE
jgi:hypothetical protein